VPTWADSLRGAGQLEAGSDADAGEPGFYGGGRFQFRGPRFSKNPDPPATVENLVLEGAVGWSAERGTVVDVDLFLGLLHLGVARDDRDVAYALGVGVVGDWRWGDSRFTLDRTIIYGEGEERRRLGLELRNSTRIALMSHLDLLGEVAYVRGLLREDSLVYTMPFGPQVQSGWTGSVGLQLRF
jgi:hypothetical protein